MFILYEIGDDFSLNTISGKSQYGDLKHAKKRAKDDNKGGKITWRQDTRVGGPKRYYGYNKANELINAIFEHPNKPKRKSNVAKKRKKARSPAQKAATKKLVALNKKRRGKKRKTTRKTKRKVTRKRNVSKKRTASRKSHLWLIFLCKGAVVKWMKVASDLKYGWTKDKGKSVLLKSKGDAVRLASKIQKRRGYASYFVGVTNAESTSAQIKAYCNEGK